MSYSKHGNPTYVTSADLVSKPSWNEEAPGVTLYKRAKAERLRMQQNFQAGRPQVLKAGV